MGTSESLPDKGDHGISAKRQTSRLVAIPLLLSLLGGCWLMHDSVALQVENGSAYDTVVDSITLGIDELVLAPGDSTSSSNDFKNEYCSVSFSYQNEKHQGFYLWSPHFESWPGRWSLSIAITDSGIVFGGAYPDGWTSLPAPP